MRGRCTRCFQWSTAVAHVANVGSAGACMEPPEDSGAKGSAPSLVGVTLQLHDPEGGRVLRLSFLGKDGIFSPERNPNSGSPLGESVVEQRRHNTRLASARAVA